MNIEFYHFSTIAKNKFGGLPNYIGYWFMKHYPGPLAALWTCIFMTRKATIYIRSVARADRVIRRAVESQMPIR